MRQLIAILPALLLLGCPGGEADSPPQPAPEAVSPAVPAGTAAIKGVAKFVGTPPAVRAIDMSGADPKCAALHTEPVKPETVVVNANGTLRNVLVYVKAGASPGEGTGEVLLDQKGCVYRPHVIGAQKGQILRIKTSDPTAHNVHSMGKQTFNQSQPAGAADLTVKLKKVEWPPFKVKCDMHPWMEAWVGVFEHPYFSVTGDDGSFEIKGLPAGTYAVVAWHEKYGSVELPLTIDLTDGQVQEVGFSFSGP